MATIHPNIHSTEETRKALQRLESFGIRKHNYASTVAPTTSDDLTRGYEAGSLWLVTSTATLYVCTDATLGAAQWAIVATGSSSGLSFKTINCPSGTDPVADSPTDILNLLATGGCTITGDDATDTITFDAAASSHTHASTQITDFNEAAQDAVGAMVDATLEYVDATPLLRRAALSGDVSAAAGSNTVTLATVPIAKGGTGQTSQTPAFDALAPTTTKGDIIVYNGTDNIRVAVGADNQVLTADAAQASGVKWAAVAGSGDVTGPASSTDNAVVRFSGATGKIIDQAATPIIHSDAGSFTFPDDQGIKWNVAGTPALSVFSGTDMFLDMSGVATGSIFLLPGASGSVVPVQLAPSDTGGANHILKQTSAGGFVTSGLLLTANITDANVTYAKIQDVSAASKLLGRGSAGGSGDVEEITVGTNLTMSGTTLSADTATKHKTRVVTIRLGAPQTNEKWPLFRVGDAFTLVKVTHKTTAGTCPFNLEYHTTIGTSTGDAWSSNKTADSTQTDDTSFDDATGAADAWVVLSVEADPSTDVGVLDIAVEYTVD